MSAKKPSPGWPEAVTTIQVRSTGDGTIQPALFWKADTDEPRPLLVALHTWSGGFRQPNIPYATWCMERQWVFVHPHVRGPNTTPQALGSELAVQDVLDAVAYARANAKVDPERIYLAGASGGGHMALLMAGRAPDVWAGVSAWVGISDVKAWYVECKARRRGYYKHILKAVGGDPTTDAKAADACRQRSPLRYLAKAKDVNLDICAGIQDGHRGSVPVSHSLRAFNTLAADADRLSEADIQLLTDKAQVPDHLKATEADPSYGKKPVLVRRQSGRTRLTIFNGGHEIIYPAALEWLAKQRRHPVRPSQ